MPISLVTGGAGFIGSHLVDALVTAGGQVRVLDDFSTGARENLEHTAGRVEIQTGCVTDPAAVERALAGCEHVYHLAAIASVQKSVEDPIRSHEVCTSGTIRVLDAARRAGVRRVIFAASSSCYGSLSGGARREDDPLSPLSPYAAAKVAGEMYCQAFTQVYGLETVRLRFFNVYGPRQDPRSPYSGVIALFAAALKEGRTPVVYGDGLQSRDFVYVGDAVQALLKAATSPAASGYVYNIGTGQSASLLDLLSVLGELHSRRIPPHFAPPRPGDVRESLADISRARRDLGYEPAVNLREGLRRLLG
jgi:UDP-glucose 4-epimerase